MADQANWTKKRPTTGRTGLRTRKLALLTGALAALAYPSPWAMAQTDAPPATSRPVRMAVTPANRGRLAPARTAAATLTVSAVAGHDGHTSADSHVSHGDAGADTEQHSLIIQDAEEGVGDGLAPVAPNAQPEPAPIDESQLFGSSDTGSGEAPPLWHPGSGTFVQPPVEEYAYDDTATYDEPYDAAAVACDSCGSPECWDYSICNDSCGQPQCFSMINPLADPQGFACRLLQRTQFRIATSQFWYEDARLPVLATSDTNPALGPAAVGLIGGPTTVNLFGGGPINIDSNSGIRFDAMLWLDDMQCRSLWLRLFDSGDGGSGFESSTANSILARPFNDVSTGTSTASTNLLTFPNQRAGSLGIDFRSSVSGGDLLMRRRLLEDDLVRSDFLWGYQSVRFAEDLTISSAATALPGSVDLPPGTSLQLFDSFGAASQFNGGTIGYLRTAREGCWYFDGMAKLGFGQMNRTVRIDGVQIARSGSPPTVSTQPIGLLARRTNSGRYEDETFVLMPELAVNAAYSLTSNLHLSVGYTYLRVPKVTRVENAIDPNLAVNLNNPLTGQLRPQFDFTETHLDVQSLDLGLMYRY